MKWFRFYSEAMHDPKVQHLRPELFKFWVNLLCLANEQPERGTLPTIDEIAYILRIKRPVVHRFCVELVVAGLIHRRDLEPSLNGQWPVTDRSLTGQWPVTTRFTIHQWAARQPSSDNVAARVKKHRARGSDISTEDDVTLHVTPGRVTCNGPDTDTDTERELIPPCIAPPTPKSEGPHIRTGDDLVRLNEAIALLASDLRTHDLAVDLGRRHTTTAALAIPGWKWLRAAQRLQDPGIPDGKRRSLPYLTAIARNLTDADRVERPATKGETPTERKRREFKEGIERQKARERAEREREADHGHA